MIFFRPFYIRIKGYELQTSAMFVTNIILEYYQTIIVVVSNTKWKFILSNVDIR